MGHFVRIHHGTMVDFLGFYPTVRRVGRHRPGILPCLKKQLTVVPSSAVQWSTSPDFSPLCGERDVTELVPPPELAVGGLIQGQRHFFRAASGNFCGWSRFMTSQPSGLVPSGETSVHLLCSLVFTSCADEFNTNFCVNDCC